MTPPSVHFFFLQCIGQNGIIKKVEDNSDVTVMFDGMEWRLNRAALVKVSKSQNLSRDM